MSNPEHKPIYGFLMTADHERNQKLLHRLRRLTTVLIFTTSKGPTYYTFLANLEEIARIEAVVGEKSHSPKK